jgi:23S rRNA (cytosine1962-C5)-methyltransferase
MLSLTFPHWHDYELIDTGGREKLERFGKYVLARPEPQAVWQKALSEEEWSKLADARYSRITGKNKQTHHLSTSPPHHLKTSDQDRGEWMTNSGMPEQWMISYDHGDLHLKFRLGLTSFGHIGVFPEQAENWEWVYARLTPPPSPSPSRGGGQGERSRVLNLFAYTGGTSLAARASGADVTHVDSVKPVITWAREIMEASGLEGIRWVVEDALKFVRREAKRGNQYDGIILDPPAYGRGPEGEKWVLEESIDEITGLCSKILKPTGFFILSLYSMGFSSLIGENLVRTHFPDAGNIEAGEFYFSDRAGRKLPLGTVVRF